MLRSEIAYASSRSSFGIRCRIWSMGLRVCRAVYRSSASVGINADTLVPFPLEEVHYALVECRRIFPLRPVRGIADKEELSVGNSLGKSLPGFDPACRFVVCPHQKRGHRKCRIIRFSDTVSVSDFWLLKRKNVINRVSEAFAAIYCLTHVN